MSPSDSFSNNADKDKTVIRPTPGRRSPRAETSQPLKPIPPLRSQRHRYRAEAKDSNPLVAEALELLSLVSRLRNLPIHNQVNELQERLIRDVSDFEKRVLKGGSPNDQVNVAKYFLCAIIDETVLNTPWGNESGWAHNSLSSLFCGKIDLGNEFFQITARLRQQPEQNINLLELAYLCLSLGFKGKHRYSNDGPHALEKEREEIYLLIRRIKGDPQPDLSGHWQGMADPRNPVTRHVPLWVLAGIAGVLLMVAYTGFSFSIHGSSDRVYDKLFAIAQDIENTQFDPPSPPPKQTISLMDRLKKTLTNEIMQKKVAVIDGPILRILNSFPSGSARIKKEYRPILTKIARELQAEKARIVVVGHTDNLKPKLSARYKSNWELSIARAENVANSLNDQGILGKRINFKGMAEKEPIASNKTKAGQALNRRIDIHIR